MVFDSNTTVLSTVILNWNRAHLLRKMIRSYLETVTVVYEMIIVDNFSHDESRDFIESVCKDRPNHRAIFLSENLGGEALNIGLKQARGQYLHISENDVEYLPGWDVDLFTKFEKFPELGQVCPFSPIHQAHIGEIWEDKAAHALTRDGVTIYVADQNVSATSIVRREVWDKGVRWKTYAQDNLRFPDDGAFSSDIKKLGYLVAWNDKYVAINWGHNIQEFFSNLPYYIENYHAKKWFGISGLKNRLRAHGYDLVANEDGKYSICPLRQP